MEDGKKIYLMHALNLFFFLFQNADVDQSRQVGRERPDAIILPQAQVQSD